MDFLVGLFSILFFGGILVLLFIVLPIALSTGRSRPEDALDDEDMF